MNDKQEQITFQWDADDYARHSSAQQEWAKELLSKLHLQGDEKLLDIGCGDGKVTAEIACCLDAGSVTGIDNSEQMVALAREKFSSSTYHNLSFHQQDARQLTYIETFDLIFSNAALHWIIDHEMLLKGMYRALKPGGRAVVQMGGKGNASQVIDAVNKIMSKSEWKQYFESFSFPYGFYSPEEYTCWLRNAGFVVESIELKPKMMNLGPESFAGWIRTTWLPYIQRIPLALRNDFITNVIETYLHQNPATELGNITTRMQRLEYVAWKGR